jgi:hypothetical protein
MVEELLEDDGGELGEEHSIPVAVDPDAIALTKRLLPASAEGDHQRKATGTHRVGLGSHARLR